MQNTLDKKRVYKINNKNKLDKWKNIKKKGFKRYGISNCIIFLSSWTIVRFWVWFFKSVDHDLSFIYSELFLRDLVRSGIFSVCIGWLYSLIIWRKNISKV